MSGFAALDELEIASVVETPPRSLRWVSNSNCTPPRGQAAADSRGQSDDSPLSHHQQEEHQDHKSECQNELGVTQAERGDDPDADDDDDEEIMVDLRSDDVSESRASVTSARTSQSGAYTTILGIRNMSEEDLASSLRALPKRLGIARRGSTNTVRVSENGEEQVAAATRGTTNERPSAASPRSEALASASSSSDRGRGRGLARKISQLLLRKPNNEKNKTTGAADARPGNELLLKASHTHGGTQKNGSGPATAARTRSRPLPTRKPIPNPMRIPQVSVDAILPLSPMGLTWDDTFESVKSSATAG